MTDYKLEILEAASGFILNRRNEALFQVKDDGYNWRDNLMTLFGGKIEDGETSGEAFQREIVEEIGLNLITNIIYLFEHPLVDQHKHHNVIRTGTIHMHCARFEGDPSDVSVKEGAGFAFISEKNLERFPIVPHNLEAVRKAYQWLKERKIPGYST
mgnify:CR=1 FL=1